MPVKSRGAGVEIADADAAVTDVRLASTFYSVAPPRKTGTADLVEHANAENTVKPNAVNEGTIRAASYSDGVTLVSATITTTKRCGIGIVACMVAMAEPVKITDIKRGGVTKTTETTISGEDTANFRMHLQYATEILDAGVYQYDLVLTGGDRTLCGLVIKAMAFNYQ